MPEPIVTNAPATPAAPAAPSAPPVVTAPAAPAIPPQNPKTGRFEPRSPIATRKPKVSAAKALGMEGTVKDGVKAAIDKTAADVARQTPNVLKYTEPTPPASTPVDPPAPVAPPEPPAAPAAPVAPPKVKLGDAEYTAEELAAKLKELDTLKSAPPAPAAPKEQPPQAPQAPAPTAEEIAKKEGEWIAQHAQTYKSPASEADLDLILTGGKEGLAKFQELLQHAHASAHLQARKSIFDQLNPTLQQVNANMQPLVQQQQQLQRYQVEQKFVTKHADFAPHIDQAKAVAEELARRFPNEVAAMTDDQFVDEVARQTDKILADNHKRWFPAGGGNWRQTAAPVAAPSAPPAAPATPPAVVPAVAPAQTPAVRPPSANAPGGFPTGPAQASWAKGVAATLR